MNVTHHVTQYVFILMKVCNLYMCPLYTKVKGHRVNVIVQVVNEKKIKLNM